MAYFATRAVVTLVTITSLFIIYWLAPSAIEIIIREIAARH